MYGQINKIQKNLFQKIVGRRSSTHVGEIQGESIKLIYSKHHKTLDGFAVIHRIDATTKYDYNAKPQAVIHNYLRKQLHNKETKHCYKTSCNKQLVLR